MILSIWAWFTQDTWYNALNTWYSEFTRALRIIHLINSGITNDTLDIRGIYYLLMLPGIIRDTHDLQVYVWFTHDKLDVRIFYVKYEQNCFYTHYFCKFEQVYAIFTQYLHDLINAHALVTQICNYLRIIYARNTQKIHKKLSENTQKIRNKYAIVFIYAHNRCAYFLRK